MPNWKVHLEVAKRVSKCLNFSESDLEQFMVGNILPDLNNGYIIKNVSKVIAHKTTHYNEEDMISYMSFYLKYKDILNKEPLILGYYTHLYTDFIWNNNFYTKIKDYEIYSDLSSEDLKILKQNDFKRFNNNFMSNKLNISDYNVILDKSKLVDRIGLKKDDIIKLANYLEFQKEYDIHYKFYSSNELDILLEDCVNLVIVELKKILTSVE